MSETPLEIESIEVLADSFLARYRRGERPDLEEYAAHHPELAGQIRDLFPALVALEAGGSELGETGAAVPIGGGAARSRSDSSATSASSARSAGGAWAWSTRRCRSRSAATSR